MLFAYLLAGTGCVTEALLLITTVPIFVMSMTCLLLGIAGVLGALFSITTVSMCYTIDLLKSKWSVRSPYPESHTAGCDPVPEVIWKREACELVDLVKLHSFTQIRSFARQASHILLLFPFALLYVHGPFTERTILVIQVACFMQRSGLCYNDLSFFT
jgi:hypothetical protein